LFIANCIEKHCTRPLREHPRFETSNLQTLYGYMLQQLVITDTS